jgi:SAM-dependent methyltransferase
LAAVTDEPDRAYVQRLAAQALAAGDQTGWFEQLYQAADTGAATVPWDDRQANPMLVSWPGLGPPEAPGSRAVVVGAGLGENAELLASLGWATTAFDVAPSAVATARRRFPSSPVEYAVADVLAPPADWQHAFDLVFEAYTVQVLRGEARRQAIANIAALVAPGGTLLVIARARNDDQDPGQFPWPLTRDEVTSFPGLTPVRIEDLYDNEQPPRRRWRAEFTAAGALPGRDVNRES